MIDHSQSNKLLERIAKAGERIAEALEKQNELREVANDLNTETIAALEQRIEATEADVNECLKWAGLVPREEFDTV